MPTGPTQHDRPAPEEPGSEGPHGPRGGSEIALVAALALAAALLLLAPVLGDPDGRILGTLDAETFTGAWVLRWGQDQLLAHGWPPSFSPDLDWPHGTSVHCLPLLDALLTLPLSRLLSPVATFSAAVGLEVAIAVIGAWLLLRPLARDRWLLLPGVVAFATTPYLVSSAASGPIESLPIGWIAIAIAAVRWAMAPGGRAWARAVIAGLALGATFLANPYYAIFTGCAGLWLGTLAARPLGWRAGLARGAAVVAVALLLAAPQMAAIATTIHARPELLPQIAHPEGARAAFTQSLVADLASFFWPTLRWQHAGFATCWYLGLALVVLALGGLRAPGARPWWVLALVTLAFVPGDHLEIAGWTPHLLGHTLPSLARPLHAWVPPFTAVQHAFRATPVLVLALAALATLGLQRLPPRWRRRAALAGTAAILLDQLALTPIPPPLPSSPVRVPEFYRSLAADPARYAVIDLLGHHPYAPPGAAVLFQSYHRHGIMLGMKPPTPPMADNALVRMAQETPEGPATPLLALCPALPEAASFGLRYIVQHRWDPPPYPRFEALKACGLPVVHEDDQVIVLELGTR